MTNKFGWAAMILAGSVFLASQQSAHAITYCMSKAEAKKRLAGSWHKFTFKDKSGKKRSARVKFHKNGKTTVVTDSGSQHTRGTWKKVGNIVHRYAPDNPGPTRFKYQIKSKC